MLEAMALLNRLLKAAEEGRMADECDRDSIATGSGTPGAGQSPLGSRAAGACFDLGRARRLCPHFCR